MGLKALVCCLSVVLMAGCATGTTLVSGQDRKPTDPDEIGLYLQPPDDYEPVGIVIASNEAGWMKQGQALAELRKQAAKIGANGILFTYYTIPDHAKSFTGQAIYVFK